MFLQELKGVEIPVDSRLQQMFSDPMCAETEELLDPVLGRIRAGDKVLASSAKAAYQAFLGYYLGKMKRTKMNRKEDLVVIANRFATLTGLHETPPITSLLVGRMGLKGVAGLNIKGSLDVKESRGRSNSSRSHSGGGRDSGNRAPSSERHSRSF
jgi:hypothetical protein